MGGLAKAMVGMMAVVADMHTGPVLACAARVAEVAWTWRKSVGTSCRESGASRIQGLCEIRLQSLGGTMQSSAPSSAFITISRPTGPAPGARAFKQKHQLFSERLECRCA